MRMHNTFVNGHTVLTLFQKWIKCFFGYFLHVDILLILKFRGTQAKLWLKRLHFSRTCARRRTFRRITSCYASCKQYRVGIWSLPQIVQCQLTPVNTIVVGGRHFWLFALAGGRPYILCTYLTSFIYSTYTDIPRCPGPRYAGTSLIRTNFDRPKIF